MNNNTDAFLAYLEKNHSEFYNRLKQAGYKVLFSPSSKKDQVDAGIVGAIDNPDEEAYTEEEQIKFEQIVAEYERTSKT